MHLLRDFPRYTVIVFLRSPDILKDALQQVMSLVRTEITDQLHFSRSSKLMKLHNDGEVEYKPILNDFGVLDLRSHALHPTLLG